VNSTPAESLDVVFSKAGRIGFILLNRPRALNALTRDMCVMIRHQLDLWANDPAIDAVIIEGEGEKAFCAGGDVVQVARAAQAERKGLSEAEADSESWRFFHDEYQMNSAIGHFQKPIISFLDGITMGGGVGISVHGAYRVATDRTLFAMPETGLGLIPDVGGSFFLPRLPDFTGLYLALGGHRLKADDCLHLGLVTHIIPHERLIDLKARLVESKGPLGLAETGVALDDLAITPQEPAPLSGRHAQIARHFSLSSVGAIIDSLEQDQSQWAQGIYADLLKKSPTSLELSFKAYHQGKDLSLDECLRMEYRIVNRILSMDDDFFEGVRALLIEKDHKPRWSPARLADIDPKGIEAHFADLGPRELILS
jgi:enoyl-CoA hydratase/carnithine racemase